MCTSFHYLLVKYVLKCGADNTWEPTSASLNYQRFHGHQVKLKWFTFYLFTLKVSSKYTYIIPGGSSVQSTNEPSPLNTMDLPI